MKNIREVDLTEAKAATTPSDGGEGGGSDDASDGGEGDIVRSLGSWKKDLIG